MKRCVCVELNRRVEIHMSRLSAGFMNLLLLLWSSLCYVNGLLAFCEKGKLWQRERAKCSTGFHPSPEALCCRITPFVCAFKPRRCLCSLVSIEICALNLRWWWWPSFTPPLPHSPPTPPSVISCREAASLSSSDAHKCWIKHSIQSAFSSLLHVFFPVSFHFVWPSLHLSAVSRWNREQSPRQLWCKFRQTNPTKSWAALPGAPAGL